jgi:hypothetical protein
LPFKTFKHRSLIWHPGKDQWHSEAKKHNISHGENIMKKFLLVTGTLLMLALTIDCRPGESTAANPATAKILFIGNSITYYNDMPAIFKSLAAAGGKDVYVNAWVRGGVILGYFAQSAQAAQIINQKQWDYVILQDGDYNIICPGDHPRLALTVNFLKDLILKNNPGTKIFFHMLHALKNGLNHDHFHYDYKAFTRKIVEGTVAFARLVHLQVAPVGMAWNEIVLNQPGIGLYDPDGMHPAYAGSYLIACVYYAAIFRETCVGNPFSGILSADDARIIQASAAKIVANFNKQ